ncbi:MAG: hypothetical protein L0228_18455 [Planctomycetes bacterium]|nr:hypothetical protein [Planctomycetota bacterium]
MSKNYRLGVVVASSALLVFFADARFALAQRIVIGGGGNQSSRDRDRDKDKDDEEKDEDENQSKNRNNRSSRSSDRSSEQIQQFLQRRQGGQSNQGGQGNPNNPFQGKLEQFRRDNRPVTFPDGQVEMQKQFRPGDNAQGLRFGNWQGDRWQGSRNVKNWGQVFAGGKQPFSAEWYKEHPKAWKYDNNKASVWVTASVPGVYSWLGWGSPPPQYNVGIINSRPIDLSHYGNWYPLGVYSLMSGPGDMGTRVVQLAIDRHGHIAGNYYDMIADANYSVSGDVRHQSQRVYWSLNKNKYIRFRVPIYRLMQPYGTMTVQLPGGEQDWQFVRLEN